KTGYVFCNGENRVPTPNDGTTAHDIDTYRCIFTALDGETMEVAWQGMVDGNLDNVDADYQGKYAFATCYNSAEGVTLAEMTSTEQVWLVIFNITGIEEAVKAGNAELIGGVPGVDGPGDSPYTRYVPVPNSPHGINAAAAGIHLVAQAK